MARQKTLNALPLRLRKLRHDRGMSARDLGAAVGVSDRQIYRYEWGKSQPPEHMVRALAAFFRKKPQWLLGWAP